MYDQIVIIYPGVGLAVKMHLTWQYLLVCEQRHVKALIISNEYDDLKILIYFPMMEYQIIKWNIKYMKIE